MSKAVVTITIGNRFQEIAKLTHPTIKRYAEKINAEFIVLSGGINFPHWKKFELYNTLKKYSRIIYVDTDIIIRDDCPDLFEIVPEDKIGMLNEGRFEQREGSLREACTAYNQDIEKWDGTYYNTGVMVISRKHRHLFKQPEKVVELGMFEQGYLNMRIIKEKIAVEDLDHNFNRIPPLDKHLGITRHDAYIIHYAGAPEEIDITKMVREDLEIWERDKPNYKYDRFVVISCGGGMGDQLCAEPVARYAINELYKFDDRKTNFLIVSHWPRFFQHLGVSCTTHDEYKGSPFPVKVLHTLPAPEEAIIWQVWTHPLAHTVDFASLSALKRQIPDDDKTIRLNPTLEGISEVFDIAGIIDGNIIIIHPGKGWESKTFPKEWWNTIISGLVEKGIKIGIIGKHLNDEQGYVDVDIPEGVIDFRDMLSLEGFISIISLAKVLITNDSSPVHIAGAFDNHIVVIPSCKHPDTILPYRQGRKHYKAVALYKELVCDKWDTSPTRLARQTADKVKGNILDYLPEPQDVIDAAIKALNEDSSSELLDKIRFITNIKPDFSSLDINHNLLIFGTFISKKPINVLELGIGNGYVTQSLINGKKYNNNEVKITCVDNLFDSSGKETEFIKTIKDLVNVVIEEEYNFVKNSADNSYDFLVSDADHYTSSLWIDEILRIVENDGIMFFHDVNNKIFAGSELIINTLKDKNIPYIIFNKNSLPDENCDRGLLMAFNKK